MSFNLSRNKAVLWFGGLYTHPTRRGSRILKWGVNFCNNVIEPINICGIRRKEGERETNSGYKHNNKVSAHGIFNLTFRMLQHTSSEVTVTKYDEI